ncbi:nicotinate-nucleotide adenylyltransferase [Fontimonas thermophila]|uniref:Probable nicotinate-nucleotide adenylyltransferase n=1 Tax=Fontimonas thermophila TaxID=1076937 RepID=A0A1I2J783_9GAMM|nr:nicotinate-nucleotide adenylyltransferase [Fontimonas thermophila]SFF48796.1 nicotinate-nucleotide adenylyltransferase [Fontimonas thermophila]
MARAVGVFGGAFAPFHNGHLRLAIEARERLALDQVRLIPTAHPPHRPDSHVLPARRLEWIKLAIRRERGLIADDREIRRDGPSYTVDTLVELRAQFPQAVLVLLMGSDAFQHLHTWYRWTELLELAHLAVVSRPGSLLEPSVETCALLAARRADDIGALMQSRKGRWFQFEVPMLDISSTRIRRLLRAGHSVRGLVPDAILDAMTAADVAALIQDDDATPTH